jgi:hypothetical protein
MKITKRQLRRIIKEERSKLLREQGRESAPVDESIIIAVETAIATMRDAADTADPDMASMLLEDSDQLETLVLAFLGRLGPPQRPSFYDVDKTKFRP